MALKMEIDVSPNIYYLSISAMQKCIRRSMPGEAVRFARVAWKCNRYRLFCRLWTVLFEDCSRNDFALRLMYDHLSGYTDFNDLEVLVLAMACGPKDRQPFNLSKIIAGQALRPVFLYNALKSSPHKEVIKLCGEWHSLKTEAYDPSEFVWDEHDFSWILELCNRAASWDWEAGYAATPYFFQKSKYQPLLKCNWVHECDLATRYMDYFPLEAIDDHTMPGKACCRIYCKRYDPNCSLEKFGSLLFFNEGAKLRDADLYNYNFRLLALDMVGLADCIDVDMSKHLVEFNGLREWYLGKNCLADMIQLKKLYLEN